MRHSPCAALSANRRFNPRIRKGCDVQQFFFNFMSNGFNPRIRKGCDMADTTSFTYYDVSIHASVKDATLHYVFVRRQLLFQSTHP